MPHLTVHSGKHPALDGALHTIETDETDTNRVQLGAVILPGCCRDVRPREFAGALPTNKPSGAASSASNVALALAVRVQ